jgi:hypothetical protein
LARRTCHDKKGTKENKILNKKSVSPASAAQKQMRSSYSGVILQAHTKKNKKKKKQKKKRATIISLQDHITKTRE